MYVEVINGTLLNRQLESLIHLLCTARNTNELGVI